MSSSYDAYSEDSTPTDSTVDGLIHGFHFGVDPASLTGDPPQLQLVHIVPSTPDPSSDPGIRYNPVPNPPNPNDYYTKVGPAPVPDPQRKAQGQFWSGLAGLLLGGAALGRMPGGAAAAAATAMAGYGQGQDQRDASRQRHWQDQMQQARDEYNRALLNWQAMNAPWSTTPSPGTSQRQPPARKFG